MELAAPGLEPPVNSVGMASMDRRTSLWATERHARDGHCIPALMIMAWS